MTTILAIGNSFSQDATHYLKQMAEADGIDFKVVNLYIGGCNLERHWKNIQTESKEIPSKQKPDNICLVSVHPKIIRWTTNPL